MYAEERWNETVRNKGYSREFIAQVKAARARRAAEKLAEQDRTRAIAKMRLRCVPMWAGRIVLETAKQHGVSPADLLGSTRMRRVVIARNEAIYLIKDCKPTLSCPRLGKWFGKDHTSILHALATHADEHGLPKLCGYDLAGVRRRYEAERIARAARQHTDRET